MATINSTSISTLRVGKYNYRMIKGKINWSVERQHHRTGWTFEDNLGKVSEMNEAAATTAFVKWCREDAARLDSQSNLMIK